MNDVITPKLRVASLQFTPNLGVSDIEFTRTTGIEVWLSILRVSLPRIMMLELDHWNFLLNSFFIPRRIIIKGKNSAYYFENVKPLGFTSRLGVKPESFTPVAHVKPSGFTHSLGVKSETFKPARGVKLSCFTLVVQTRNIQGSHVLYRFCPKFEP